MNDDALQHAIAAWRSCACYWQPNHGGATTGDYIIRATGEVAPWSAAVRDDYPPLALYRVVRALQPPPTRHDDDPVTVYRLRDPRKGAVRYIGQTRARLGARLSQHMSTALICVQDVGLERSNRKTHWLYRLHRAGKRPIIEPIEQTTAQQAQEREQYWISAYRALGADLLNIQRDRTAQAADVRHDSNTLTVRMPGCASCLTMTHDGHMLRINYKNLLRCVIDLADARRFFAAMLISEDSNDDDQ